MRVDDAIGDRRVRDRLVAFGDDADGRAEGGRGARAASSDVALTAPEDVRLAAPGNGDERVVRRAGSRTEDDAVDELRGLKPLDQVLDHRLADNRGEHLPGQPGGLAARDEERDRGHVAIADALARSGVAAPSQATPSRRPRMPIAASLILGEASRHRAARRFTDRSSFRSSN